MRHVDFRIVRRDHKATCECGVEIASRPDDSYEVSPHLREVHGFGEAITFSKISEVICPPMIVMRATG